VLISSAEILSQLQLAHVPEGLTLLIYNLEIKRTLEILLVDILNERETRQIIPQKIKQIKLLHLQICRDYPPQVHLHLKV